MTALGKLRKIPNLHFLISVRNVNKSAYQTKRANTQDRNFKNYLAAFSC